MEGRPIRGSVKFEHRASQEQFSSVLKRKMSQLNKPWTVDPTLTKESWDQMKRISEMSFEEYKNLVESQPEPTPKEERDGKRWLLDIEMRDTRSWSEHYLRKNQEDPGQKKFGFSDYKHRLKNQIRLIGQLQSMDKEGRSVITPDTTTTATVNLEQKSRPEVLGILNHKMKEAEAWMEYIRRHTMDPYDFKDGFDNYRNLLMEVLYYIQELEKSMPGGERRFSRS